MPHNLRNFYRTHVYLCLNRLDSVLMSCTPAPLYTDLIKCLNSKIGEFIRPFTSYTEIDCSYVGRVRRRDFNFPQNTADNSVLMKKMPELEIELNNFKNKKNL